MYIGNCRHAEICHLYTVSILQQQYEYMLLLPLMCSIVGHTMEAKDLPQSQIEFYQIEGSIVWLKSICESSHSKSSHFCFTVGITLRSSQTCSQHCHFTAKQTSLSILNTQCQQIIESACLRRETAFLTQHIIDKHLTLD